MRRPAVPLPVRPSALRPPERPAATPRDWYRIRAAADTEDTVQIDLYDEIGGWFWGIDAATFVRDLRGVEAATIELHVNSPGGDVYDAIAIMNGLRQHDARVVAIVDGLAASAASLIAVGAGDEVVMCRNSEMMIHNPWMLAIGDAEDMRRAAADLERISANCASVYLDRAGGELADWRAAMDAETWYSDAEAVDAGLADRVLNTSTDDEDGAAAAARFDLSVFAFAGRSRAPKPAAPAARADTRQERSRAVAMSDEQLDKMREALGLPDDATEADIVKATEKLAAGEDDGGDGDGDGEEKGETEGGTGDGTEDGASSEHGTVTVDAEAFASLRRSAKLGEEAHVRQQREDRVKAVEEAVTDGRVAPAARQRWLNQLERDPQAAEVLASLEKGLIPVGPEFGHSVSPADEPGSVKAVRESAVYKNWST